MLKNILTIILTFCLSTALGQTDLIVNFGKSDSIAKTNDFKFTILSPTDTVIVFDTSTSSKIKKNRIELPITRDSIKGIFEYRTGIGGWKKVQYTFGADTTDLKRIEIDLYFSVNSNKIEFLQELTVNKYYGINSISIKSGKLKVGSQPIFMLISNSDTAFYGASLTNHFYGTMKFKTEYGWLDFSGSYCLSTVPEKTLTKFDTVYSWVPNYNIGDEYTIKKPGTYKYVVAMGLDRFSEGIPTKLIDKGETRMRTRTFFEPEIEFKVLE